jgi:pSer/pThr/pTyr-binding forkhead associated (FHA) protein
MSSLLTVTGRRITLEPDRSYVLGRGPDCDIVVEDTASSRRHARLDVGAGTLLVEDLGSRNGTFVNEEPISGRVALEQGCRLRIGASVYLVAGADGEEHRLDTGTLASEKLSFAKDLDESILQVVRRDGQGRTELAGQLGAFSFIDLLQMLVHTRRSGTLHVAVERGSATLDVRQGEICSASYEELQGFQALLMLARKRSGVFWLVPDSSPCRRMVQTPAARLLVELCCALDGGASS